MKPISEWTPVERGLMLLIAGFGGELDAFEKRAYERLLKDIPGDIVLAAMERLLKEAASGRAFYPMPRPHDCLRACQDEIVARRAEAMKAGLPDCAVCDNERWVEELDKAGVARLRRCDCWQLRLQAADAAGTLLALPPRSSKEEDG